MYTINKEDIKNMKKCDSRLLVVGQRRAFYHTTCPGQNGGSHTGNRGTSWPVDEITGRTSCRQYSRSRNGEVLGQVALDGRYQHGEPHRR